jgi:hypothetical protein
MLSIPYFGYEAISKFYETILRSFLKNIYIIINVADMVYHTISSPKIIFTKLSSFSYSLFLKMHAMVHMPFLAFLAYIKLDKSPVCIVMQVGQF